MVAIAAALQPSIDCGFSMKYNHQLSNYFSHKPLYLDGDNQKNPYIRKLMEQPWQMTQAGMWDEVTETLCNLDFIQAKAAAKLTYDLVDDFNMTLNIIPDNAENMRIENEHQASMQKYTLDLIAYAKGEIKDLDIPKSLTPLTNQEIGTEVKRIMDSPSQADKLRDFANFLGKESYNLQLVASDNPNYIYQQAWNYALDGPVGKAANKITDLDTSLLFLKPASSRRKYIPLPQIIKTLDGHTGWVTCVAITPDGKRAISGSDDHTCIFWDLENGRTIYLLKGHEFSVRSVSMTPDGRWALTSTGESGVLRKYNKSILWDLISGKMAQAFDFVESPISITPDGKRAISVNSDKGCVALDMLTGQVIKEINIDAEHTSSVSITPDGKKAIINSKNNLCVLLDLEKGIPIYELEGHTKEVTSLCMTPDGKKAISGSKDSTCILWDLENGKTIFILNGHDHYVNSVCITPDGKRAVSGSSDNSCILWDLERGNKIRRLKGHTGTVDSVSITPDGRRAISGSWDNSVILWDLERGNDVRVFKGHLKAVTTVSITSDGKRAISGSVDKNVILWDLKTGKAISKFEGHNNMVETIGLNFDGKKALSGSWDNTCILWNLDGDQVHNILIGHTGCVNSVSVTPDGSRAFSGSLDSTCILWDLHICEAIRTFRGHSKYVSRVCITPTGTKAISISYDKTCVVWDLERVKLIYTLKEHTDQVTDICLSPDGTLAITCSRDRSCILWDVERGKVIHTIKVDSIIVESVSITPDGKKAILGLWDFSCILWDLPTGNVIHTLKGHNGVVTDIYISADGKRALTNAEDKTCILWNIETGEKLLQYPANSFGLKMAVNSKTIVLGLGSGEVSILLSQRTLLCPSIPIITAREIWDFIENKYQPLSADCPFCGLRFSPDDDLKTTLREIHKNNKLRPDDIPSLKLPDEVWDDKRLLSMCPLCKEQLRYNPFIAAHLENESRASQDATRDSLTAIADNSITKGYWEAAIASLEKLLLMETDSADIKSKLAFCLIKHLKDTSEAKVAEIERLLDELKASVYKEKAIELREMLQQRITELSPKKRKSFWERLKR